MVVSYPAALQAFLTILEFIPGPVRTFLYLTISCITGGAIFVKVVDL